MQSKYPFIYRYIVYRAIACLSVVHAVVN